MRTPVDLDALQFMPAPTSFDQSGTLTRCEIALLPDGRQLIASDSKVGAALTLETYGGRWISSSDHLDWPELSRRLGDWILFLEDWRASS